jgi:hypothetical protein
MGSSRALWRVASVVADLLWYGTCVHSWAAEKRRRTHSSWLGRKEETTRGLLGRPIGARTVRCQQPHPAHVWLGPASTGAHPRTKGTRFCVDGHRHRIPLTARDIPMACVVGKPLGDLRYGRKKRRSGARAWRNPWRSYLQACGWARLGGTRTRFKNALRAGRPAGCWIRAMPPRASTAHAGWG